MHYTTPDDNRWHLDKKVPVGIILALLMQAAAGIWAIADIKKDVELLKARGIEQRERDDRQDRDAAQTDMRIQSALEKIDSKLDRLIEKGAAR